jgi:hypothetical protein
MFPKALVCTFSVLIAIVVSGCASTEHAQNAAAAAATQQPLPDRKLREQMVTLIEPTMYFRTILDGAAPRLLNAKVSRAFEYRSMFQPQQRFYCVSVEIEQPLSGLIPTVRAASFPILKLPDGTESLGFMRIDIQASSPAECSIAKYEPFPELEQARTKRRLALGKPA